MDEIKLIVEAITLGAAAGGKDVASKVVNDAYEGLKSIVASRFKGDASAEVALAETEKDAETWAKPLAKAVADHELTKDEAILALARKVLDLTEEGRFSPKYNISVEGSSGVVIGDQADVNMSFGDGSSDKAGRGD